jgi:hypothetical protein
VQLHELLGFQDWFGDQDACPVLVVALLAAVSFAFVAIDWRARGPRVALQNSSLAAFLSLLVVAPLGFAAEEHVVAWSLIGVAVFGLGTALSLMVAFGYVGLAAGALVAFVSLANHARLGHFLVEPLGVATVFVSLYLALREAMTVRRVSQWPGVTQVDPDSPEFQERVSFFTNSCAPWAHKYHRIKELSIIGLYRVKRPASFSRARPSPNCRPLFHGTSWSAAKGIVSDGFRLPSRAGMFGRGIYFADCPLKSWQYCSHSLGNPVPCFRRGGLILMCMVDLGEQRPQAQANPSLRGFDRKGFWAWLSSQRGAYDSVVGVEQEQGGVLRVPEYVVYNPQQARIDYIVEVSDSPQAAPGYYRQ